MRLRIKLVFTVVVIFGLFCGQAIGQTRLDLGSTAPALSGIDMLGSPFSLADYRGKWVYLDFWASWCGPCMNELPEVIKLQQRLGGNGDFDVVSVSLDTGSTAGKLSNIVNDFKINYPVLYDERGGANPNIRQWNVREIPATFLIDPKGVVVARDLKPTEVDNRINIFHEPTYKPIRLESREVLHKGSPTSGNKAFRDLQINIEFKDDGPSISRYQVYVSTVCGNIQTGPDHSDVLYDLRIATVVRNGKSQYSVDIRKTSGTSYFEGKSTNSAGNTTIPDMAVVIDPNKAMYQFVVPVPGCSTKVNYAVALYDDQLNEFVKNGMTTLDTGSGY